MEFRVLGPVEVRAAGRLVDAGPPRQRSVLAALAVDVGRTVMVETLIDRVWGQAPPERARHALYVYIARIRSVIGQASASDGTAARLERRSGGYVLDVDPDCVDVHRFKRLVDQARDPHCSDAKRAGLFREALDLWRGEPLADLPGEWAARVREGWQKQRLDTVAWWAQAELHLGNGDAVIGPLTELAAEHPLAEALVATLMRALHAAGRSADALEHYRTTRQRLVEQLGIDPGTELQELHQAILRGNLDQTPLAPVPALAAPAPAVPAQLPLEVPSFTGRGDELAQLDAILAETDRQSAAVVISAIAGTAGVGKTALAVHWARRVAGRFPDGQLYVNLRGFDPVAAPMQPGEAIRGFLDAFEVPPERIPTSPQAQVGLYRSLLTGRRVLIVLDNARDAEQVRPLLPGSPGCLVIVTSRNQLPGLVATEGAHPLTLDLLSTGEAHHLLARRLGTHRLAAEPTAVTQIIASCARLPLALAIVAARAATHPTFPLAVLASELHDAHTSLDALSAGDPATDIRAVFSWSYHTLTPPAARLFRLLGLHPGSDITTPAAASLAGVPPAQARTLLAELARAHLVTEPTPGRYTFHDLLRAYATELTHRTDPHPDRHAAIHRGLDHYLHTAISADRQLNPYRDPLTVPSPRTGATPEHLPGNTAALHWFTTHRPTLLAAIQQAASTGFDTHAVQLAWALITFFEWRGHWQDWLATQSTALHAAQRLNDLDGQAQAHRGLGRVHARLGQHQLAHTHYQQALQLFAQLGEHTGAAHTRLGQAALLARQGRHREALDHAEQALAVYQATGHRDWQADALNAVGWCQAQLGDYPQALAYCQQALALMEGSTDRYSQANTLDSLGYIHHQLGQHQHAVTLYQQALDLYRELGNRNHEADTLHRLGDAQHATGHSEVARDTWQQALSIYRELGHPDAEQVRAKLRPDQ